MFAELTFDELFSEEYPDRIVSNPKPAYTLRDRNQTLQEFYYKLRHHFKFVCCGAAHHFPGVVVQNPENCPWKSTNAGCTHADMGNEVTSEFFWASTVLKSLNKRIGNLIVAPRDHQEMEYFFMNEFAFHPGSPDLKIYYKGNRLWNRKKFQAEVARVQEFQRTKSEFFFIFLNYVVDRIQEILLIPEELSHLLPTNLQDISVETETIHDDLSPGEIPQAFTGTNLPNVMQRMNAQTKRQYLQRFSINHPPQEIPASGA